MQQIQQIITFPLKTNQPDTTTTKHLIFTKTIITTDTFMIFGLATNYGTICTIKKTPKFHHQVQKQQRKTKAFSTIKQSQP